MSDNITEGLGNIAAQAGLNVEAVDAIPSVRCDLDLRQTAIALGKHCATLDLIRMNGVVYYFDHEGEQEVMTGRKFRTWIAKYLVVYQKKKQITDVKGDQVIAPVPYTLRIDDSTTILETDDFLSMIKKVAGVNNVRLPIERKSGAIELLPIGYDKESEIWTKRNALTYDDDVPLDVAKGWFGRYFGSFPFSDERSKGVQIAAMLSIYVKHLLPVGALRPGFLFYANQPGSGKSVLAKASVYPVLGNAAAVKMQEGENFDKMLEAFSINGVPYIFLDNVYGSLKSASLDQMLTSSESMGRAMGGHGVFVAKNEAQIFITGNNLELNEDAQRRFLIVDLFEKGDPRSRVVENPISDYVMRSDEYRAEALASLWSIVRNWADLGKVKGEDILPTFESYSRLMGGIVSAAGYHNPMARAEMLNEVNPEKVEFLKLLVAVALEMKERGETTADWTAQQFAKLARDCNLLEEKIGTSDDGRRLSIKQDGLKGELASMASDQGYMDSRQGSSFGKFLGGKVGQIFNLDGFTLEFASRNQRRKKSYTLELRQN